MAGPEGPAEPPLGVETQDEAGGQEQPQLARFKATGDTPLQRALLALLAREPKPSVQARTELAKQHNVKLASVGSYFSARSSRRARLAKRSINLSAQSAPPAGPALARTAHGRH